MTTSTHRSHEVYLDLIHANPNYVELPSRTKTTCRVVSGITGNVFTHNRPMKLVRMPKSGCSCRQAGVIFFAWISIAISPFVSGFVEGPSCTTHRRWLKGRHRDSALPSRTSAPARPTIGMVAAEPVAGLLNTVTVDLEDRSYPIYIGSGILESGDLLRRHVTSKKALVVTNDKVGPLYLENTVKVLEAGGVEVETVVLPDGEEFKSLEVLTKILDKSLEARLDRKCTFVALGGGVIGDMVGFAAAIYQRGVKFVQVPTTLMAMVDSAVGGKTAVNHPLGKNMIGAFYQPQAVLADMDTLKSLPDRELASGIAEVVKYGLIKDGDFFVWQEGCMERMAARDPAVLAEAVERSCVNKAKVVAADEKEAGLRATLNLGHTFGHAIETGLGYGKLLHGEAVAIGMHMAADMSRRMGWVDRELVDRSVKLMERAGLPVELPKGGGMNMDKFLNAMAVDKKVSDGQLRLILLKGALGGCVLTADFDGEAMKATIQEFCDRQ